MMSSATDTRPILRPRDLRRRELLETWKSKSGKEQVLSLLWTYRAHDNPLRAGDSVMELILEHEFGADGQE